MASPEGIQRRWWTYIDFDSTTRRQNNHNLRTGADVVWKVVLPQCFDSLQVHFAYHDSSRGQNSLATGYALFVINPTTHDTVELLENSYDYVILTLDGHEGWFLGKTGVW